VKENEVAALSIAADELKELLINRDKRIEELSMDLKNV